MIKKNVLKINVEYAKSNKNIYFDLYPLGT